MMLVNSFVFGSPSPAYEHWFKFDGNLLNSGTLECTAPLASGSVSYSSVIGVNTGQSVNPDNTIIQLAHPVSYALGTNFYVEFYATFSSAASAINKSIINTNNGFDLRHQADGKLILSTPVEANIFTTTLSYKDDVKRKFKLTFISGAVSLYVDNVLTNTGTTSILDFDVSRSLVQLFIFATPGHHYDDLIIHRN